MRWVARRLAPLAIVAGAFALVLVLGATCRDGDLAIELLGRSKPTQIPSYWVLNEETGQWVPHYIDGVRAKCSHDDHESQVTTAALPADAQEN